MNKTAAFTIFNASAGSGKTFTLVKEYLKRILSTPEFGEGQIFTNFVQEFKDLLGPRELTTEEIALALAANSFSKKSHAKRGETLEGPWDNLTEFRNI